MRKPRLGTLAALAIDSNIGVYEVPFEDLKKRLEQDGQVLEYHQE